MYRVRTLNPSGIGDASSVFDAITSGARAAVEVSDTVQSVRRISVGEILLALAVGSLVGGLTFGLGLQVAKLIIPAKG